jgi:hypothetical protein
VFTLFDAVKDREKDYTPHGLPAYARAEYTYLHRHCGKITDSLAWASKMLTQWQYNHHHTLGSQVAKGIVKLLTEYTAGAVDYLPLDWLYSLSQLEYPEGLLGEWLHLLCKDNARYYQVTFEDWRYMATKRPSLDALSWIASDGRVPQHYSLIAKYIHPTLLKRIVDVSKVAMLLRDIPRIETRCVHYFTSLNMLQDEHDREAAAAARKLKERHNAIYSYTFEFLQLAKDYKFELPGAAMDLYHRGQAHRNCVASYARVHETNSEDAIRVGEGTTNERYALSRILLCPEYTIELKVYIVNDVISSATLAQCLGYRNQTFTATDQQGLCAVFQGRSPDILKVGVTYGKSESEADNSA